MNTTLPAIADRTRTGASRPGTPGGVTHVIVLPLPSTATLVASGPVSNGAPVGNDTTASRGRFFPEIASSVPPSGAPSTGVSAVTTGAPGTTGALPARPACSAA